MNIKLLIFITAWGLHFSCSQKNIPEYLRECYENSTIQENRMPMNLRVLIDLIRKAERHSETSMDMRSIAVSLLHRFKFDGVEYYPDVISQKGVLPFGGTGSQRSKNRIIEELIPGRAEAFPAEALTLLERCALHRAISNTVWEHSAASEDEMCIDGVTEKILDRSIPDAVKICPIEYGVILTPHGTIAPGATIAAIAASLQPQNVTLKLLLDSSNPSEETKFNYNEDEVDLVVPKNKMSLERSMWLNIIKTSTAEIDNIWAATVAGDLAEMAVYQGPLVGKRMVLGVTGFWNSSMRPNIYYIMGRDGTFDATRAEIIGGIDGLIIAKNLPGWIEKFRNLRLSQVLDMYYSNRGLHVDGIVRACDRGTIFRHVAPKTVMEEQTYAMSQILAYRNSIAYMSEEVLETMVNHAVDKFTTYTNHHLFTELHCQKIEKIYPRVETIVAFDGAWSQEYTADFLAVLLDDIDVSVFGSKIGILHGTTGEWMLNVTNSPAKAYEAFDRFDNFTWPLKINFAKVFASASAYYDKMWRAKHENHTIGNLGQVIVFLAPRVRFTVPIEQESILESLQELKAKHPDLHFVYYVSVDNAPLFLPFLLSVNDHLVQTSSINDINDALLTVSRVLRPAPCNLNVTKGTRDQIEDYVKLRESTVYRLDPFWRRNTEKVTLTAHNVDYGTIEVCTWNQRKNNARREGYYCRELSGHNEMTIIDYATCNDRAVSPCSNTTHYQIRGISTRKQCTEIDCRTPEHIRYILRVENLYCSHATNITKMVQLFIAIAIIICIF